MKSYGCVVHFHSPPVAVFTALTDPAGLCGWWTRGCRVGRELGEFSQLEFEDGRATVKIVRLEPEQKVEWRCTEHFLDAPGEVSRSDEWVGTTMKFHLSPAGDGGTEMWFQHAGLTEELDCFGISSDFWEFFLCTSLREYVDTGTGRPYDPDAAGDQA